MKLAFPVIISPYIFVYNNALLMHGTFWQIIAIILLSLSATYLACCAFERHYFIEMNLLVSIILGAGAILIVVNNFRINILGFLIIGIITIYNKIQQKKKNTIVDSVDFSA
jgi:TRAP-type uncharacterized transport system fused permease subunit